MDLWWWAVVWKNLMMAIRVINFFVFLSFSYFCPLPVFLSCLWPGVCEAAGLATVWKRLRSPDGFSRLPACPSSTSWGCSVCFWVRNFFWRIGFLKFFIFKDFDGFSRLPGSRLLHQLRLHNVFLGQKLFWRIAIFKFIIFTKIVWKPTQMGFRVYHASGSTIWHCITRFGVFFFGKLLFFKWFFLKFSQMNFHGSFTS